MLQTSSPEGYERSTEKRVEPLLLGLEKKLTTELATIIEDIAVIVVATIVLEAAVIRPALTIAGTITGEAKIATTKAASPAAAKAP